MERIERFIPTVCLSVTLGHIYGNLSAQELGSVITPVNSIIIGATLLFTTKKIIELAVGKFGSEHMKSASKSAPWLIAPAFTTGIMALTGITTTVSAVAISVAFVAYMFFYHEEEKIVNQVVESDFEYTFASIAGMEGIKKKLSEEVIIPIKNPEKAARYHVGHPRGIIFHGPPGCGKTAFAKALAGELKLPFTKITVGDIASPYQTGNVIKIREVFSAAISQSPCILFLDEFDGIATTREGAGLNRTTINERITELITQIDKAIAAKVIIIAATNCKNALDEAIVRTGRFDTEIEIGLPDEGTRRKLFNLFLEKHVTQDIQYENLVKKSEGYSCSDIEIMVENAAKKALYQAVASKSEDIVPITMEMFQYDELAKKSEGYNCSDIEIMVENAAKKALYQALDNKTEDLVPITMEMFQ